LAVPECLITQLIKTREEEKDIYTDTEKDKIGITPCLPEPYQNLYYGATAHQSNQILEHLKGDLICLNFF